MSNLNYGVESGKVQLFNIEGKLRCQNCNNGLGLRNSQTVLLQTSVSLLQVNDENELELVLRCGQCKNLTSVPIEVKEGKILYKKFERKLNI